MHEIPGTGVVVLEEYHHVFFSMTNEPWWGVMQHDGNSEAHLQARRLPFVQAPDTESLGHLDDWNCVWFALP
jgi:hypothetical protein